MSRRGLCIGFLAAAAFLATAAWLRPPLSRDLRGHHIPLSWRASGDPSSETLLEQPHRFRWDSVGGILLGLIGVSLAVALWKPNRLGTCAGMLLAAGLAGNAVAAFNHPSLINRLNHEQEQRMRLVRVVRDGEASASADTGNGRVKTPIDEVVRQTGLWRGRVFLLHGQWFVIWAAVGVVFGGRGRVTGRLVALGCWGLVGLGLAGAACLPRLWAELDWGLAQRLEFQGDLDGSRRALAAAVARVPELEDLERAWLLTGKLDFLQGRFSPYRRFWDASQFAANKEWPQANARITELLKEVGAGRPAVRRQAARFYKLTGLKHFQDGQLAPARDAWRQAAQLDPADIEAVACLAIVQARIDPSAPEQIEADLAPALRRLADRTLRADLLATVGDAYFDAGRVQEARQCYDRSKKAFTLPKVINYRAQKGLGGM